MEIAESRQDGVIILGLNGRLDASNAHAFEAKLLALIDAGEQRFVIDCAKLDYISSAGLRALLVGGKRLKTSGGQIGVAALQEHIKEVFDIAGFSSIFHVYRTPAEAVAALR